MNRKLRRTAQKKGKNQKTLSHSEVLKKAMRLHQEGHLEEAEKVYRKLITVSAVQPDALNFLGILTHQTGRSEESIKLLERSIQLTPNYTDAYNNLGNVYKELGRLKEARAAYDNCLKLDPDNANGLSNLGTVLKELKKYTEAAALYNRAIKINPQHAEAFHNLGVVLKKEGKIDEAVEAYRQAIGLRPYDADAYQALGRMLFRVGRHKEAIGVFEQWLQFVPDNPIARHLLAACSGKGVPGRASDAFVAKTFDSFSGSFDKVLEGLGYRAPELLLAAFRNLQLAVAIQLTILDAGCGTGLCGPLFHPYTKQLVGVDLSSGMVAKARGRELYDQLHVAELVQFMASKVKSYDLIISADTLCYFGELEQVCQAGSQALIEGGHLIFTLEAIVDPEPDECFRLNPHGRYSHNQEYVEQVLLSAQLKPVSIAWEVLRKEAGEPVEGLVVVAVKMLL